MDKQYYTITIDGGHDVTLFNNKFAHPIAFTRNAVIAVLLNSMANYIDETGDNGAVTITFGRKNVKNSTQKTQSDED